MIKLTLPYPISANRYWRTYMPKGHRHPVTVVSSEAKKYKTQVKSYCFSAGIKKPIMGNIEVQFDLYPHLPKNWKSKEKKDPLNWDDSVRCIDLDNAQKVLFDSLKNIVFEDDKRVRKIIAERKKPDGAARIEIRIQKI